MFSSPEPIILFGSVIKAGDFILRPTQKYMLKKLVASVSKQSQTGSKWAKWSDMAIICASTLVWEMKAQ
jgi:glucokinase